LLLGGLISALSACASLSPQEDVRTDPFIEELPVPVLAIVAPFQNLSAVKINPSDGCYLYRHAGPVETTFLPLRTVEGRPICTALPELSETS
jgi:hypothetical protein